MKHSSKKIFAGLALIAGLAAAGSVYAEGGTIANIKARGQLTVGTEAAYEPYEFIKDGNVVGYGKDILDYMTQKLGVKLNQLIYRFKAYCQASSPASSTLSPPVSESLKNEPQNSLLPNPSAKCDPCWWLKKATKPS